ncbi:hypothetical protein [Allosphingosinicella indica]|uniref:Uncharacterized protein n=1 Tax=Allosphingosinicella indica TaxID=941907 RepID=A0A1X7GR33_9SPHN|nr:hypothetical protein [Allosphingosinicella indica]SMF72700.1 hypothetical protein SAMN06295910_2059 [Allosphingosinicella indica]
MKAPLSGAIERIEAALRSALSARGEARRANAREALAGDSGSNVHLEAWLEAVAVELQSGRSAMVPDDMVDVIAQRMLADRGRSLGAHAQLDAVSARNLIR